MTYTKLLPNKNNKKKPTKGSQNNYLPIHANAMKSCGRPL